MATPDAKAKIALELNGEAVEVAFAPHKTLLEVLREDLGLTGTKHGCELGECGACAVLVDGRPVLSCLLLGLEAEGAEVRTVEGLADAPALSPLQAAFADGRARVTGQTRFAGDLGLPRMLHCKILRATLPHAEIGAVDATAARAASGVRLVLTGAGLPIPYGILPVSQDEHALAVGKVRFV